MHADETLFTDRFEPLANKFDDSDWLDVVRRSRRPQRRRFLLLIGIATALAVVATAVAFGWPGSVIDFFHAKPAPKPVVRDFGSLNVSAPPGMNPRAIPSQARQVTTAIFGGKRHTLYIAPTKDGSFCFTWSGWAGGCATQKSPKTTISVTYEETQSGLPRIIGGYLLARDALSLEVRFADKTHATVPANSVTWVSSPINAGFFIYEVPSAHLNRSRAAVELIARRSDGSVAARNPMVLRDPLDRERPRRLPDGTRVSLPVRAEVGKARKLIGFRAENGSAVWLWVMPSRNGGRCYVFNQGSGCLVRPDHRGAGGLSIGGKRVLFFAQVEPQVAAVDLRYQDGGVERLLPIEGFVLYEIGSKHYPQGHRLLKAVAVNGAGRVIAHQSFQPQTHGIYPCSKPVARGYGVKSCP